MPAMDPPVSDFVENSQAGVASGARRDRNEHVAFSECIAGLIFQRHSTQGPFELLSGFVDERKLLLKRKDRLLEELGVADRVGGAARGVSHAHAFVQSLEPRCDQTR